MKPETPNKESSTISPQVIALIISGATALIQLIVSQSSKLVGSSRKGKLIGLFAMWLIGMIVSWMIFGFVLYSSNGNVCVELPSPVGITQPAPLK